MIDLIRNVVPVDLAIVDAVFRLAPFLHPAGKRLAVEQRPPIFGERQIRTAEAGHDSARDESPHSLVPSKKRGLSDLQSPIFVDGTRPRKVRKQAVCSRSPSGQLYWDHLANSAHSSGARDAH